MAEYNIAYKVMEIDSLRYIDILIHHFHLTGVFLQRETMRITHKELR